LHAGDVCTASVLVELSSYAPVRVVLGNNDGHDVDAWGAQETLGFEIAGAAVFLGSKAGDFMTGQTMVIDGGATIS
jgi:predicted phosphodiesterase